jgi:hypothetical protein
MKDFLGFILPIVVGALVVPLYDGVQKMVGLLNGLPPYVTRVLVGATAFLISKGVTAGIALTGADVTSLTSGDVGALASAGLAFLFKSADVGKVT